MCPDTYSNTALSFYQWSWISRFWRHTTKCGVGRICGADLNGDNLQISTAYLQISDYCRVTVRVWVRLGSGSGLELRLGLQIVIYKLLEKVTKCGSVMWLKLTNGDVPRRSAPLRILSCPDFGCPSNDLGVPQFICHPKNWPGLSQSSTHVLVSVSAYFLLQKSLLHFPGLCDGWEEVSKFMTFQCYVSSRCCTPKNY